MVWEIKDKEQTIKNCFAVFPKRIGNYRVWLSTYYKTWDYFYDGLYTCYVPHYFLSKEKALKHVEDKKKEEYSYGH